MCPTDVAIQEGDQSRIERTGSRRRKGVTAPGDDIQRRIRQVLGQTPRQKWRNEHVVSRGGDEDRVWNVLKPVIDVEGQQRRDPGQHDIGSWEARLVMIVLGAEQGVMLADPVGRIEE